MKKEKEKAEFKAVKLASTEAEQLRQQGAMAELLEQLQVLDGSNLHYLRVRLSESIKRVIALIALYPGGRLLADARRKVLRDNLTEAGYSGEEINSYLDSVGTIPSKADRYMTIAFKNNESLLISNEGVTHNLKEMVSAEEYLNEVNVKLIDLI